MSEKIKSIKDIEKVSAMVQKRINEKLDKIPLKELGEFSSELIKKRTRLGFGVSGELEEKSRFEKLKESTVKSRASASRSNVLSELTSPKKSNLTRTGELLDSIFSKVVGKKIVISFKGQRKTGSGTNKEIAGYVSVKRPFFFISRSEFEQIKRFIRNFLKKK